MEPLTLVRIADRDAGTASKLLIVRNTSKTSAWRFKACRRCGGDQVHQTDEFGFQDYTCIQCGASEPSPTRAA